MTSTTQSEETSEPAAKQRKREEQSSTELHRTYFYKDLKGEIFGPFEFKHMKLWTSSGFFEPDLLIAVKLEGDGEKGKENFKPLSEYSELVDLLPQQQHKEKEEEKETSSETPSTTASTTTPTAIETTLNTPKYFYKDAKGETFGPFELEQMKLWISAGFFTADLLVAMKKGEQGKDEIEFKPVSQYSELLCCFPPVNPTEKEKKEMANKAIAAAAFAQQWELRRRVIEESILMQQAQQQQQQQQNNNNNTGQQYSLTGKFNLLTGKFQQQTSAEYWGKRKLPTDGSGRQLSMYLDVEAYQQERRRKQFLIENGLAKPKAKKPAGQKKKKPLYSP